MSRLEQMLDSHPHPAGSNGAAALRCIRVTEEIGGVLMIIDAKNERAANWYASYGAEPLMDHPLTLVVPLATFAAALKASGHL